MRLEIKSGKRMKFEILKKVDKIWNKEFPGNDPLLPKQREDFEEDIFFILYLDKKILSTGRLRPVSIIFLEKNYEVLGIADIVSVEKGKGYGKIIMQAIHKYLKNKNKIGIGFCRKENSPFYIKSGLGVAPGLVKRFIFIIKSKIIRDTHDQDVIFSKNSKKFIEKIVKNKNQPVISLVKSW